MHERRVYDKIQGTTYTHTLGIGVGKEGEEGREGGPNGERGREREGTERREKGGTVYQPPKATYFICNTTPDAFIPMRECPALPSCKGEGGGEGRGEGKGEAGREG